MMDSEAVRHLAGWPLRKLRRHQSIILSQFERAYGDPLALARLQRSEAVTAAAIDRKVFGN